MMPEDEKEICEIKDCDNEVVRSISTGNLLKSLPKVRVADERKKRTHICKEHYKQFKKATKEERKLQRMGW